jgi:chromosome segregation ATPase
MNSPKKNPESDSPDNQDSLIERIEELETELSKKNQALKYHEEEISDLKYHIQELVADKREISDKLDNLQLMQIELKINDYNSLKDDYNKLKHRTDVTKKLLDQARNDLKILKKVLEDLEKRGILDFLLGRYPESYQEYKKEFNPEKG